MNYLKLIRLPNLLMIAVTQLLIKYFLFAPFQIDVALNGFGFSLLIIATLCLAAAGNVINDIFDVQADLINKPEKVVIGKAISEKAAYNFFIVLNVIGVGIGFYLSNAIEKPIFSAIFILVSGLLYMYSSFLKGYIIIGNIVISVLVALTIIIVGLYDLMPVIDPQNRATQTTMFSILTDYAIFAFLMNWIREMVKDQQDITGDYKTGVNTLPIALGSKRTNLVIFLISLLPLAAIIYYLYTYLYQKQLAVLFTLIFVIAPLLYFMVKIFNASTQKHYKHLSLVLKLIMVCGLLSIGLYKFILK